MDLTPLTNNNCLTHRAMAVSKRSFTSNSFVNPANVAASPILTQFVSASELFPNPLLRGSHCAARLTGSVGGGGGPPKLSGGNIQCCRRYRRLSMYDLPSNDSEHSRQFEKSEDFACAINRRAMFITISSSSSTRRETIRLLGPDAVSRTPPDFRPEERPLLNRLRA